MKKRNMFIGYFVLIMLIATFVACASTSKHESTGEYVDDSVITTRVKSIPANDVLHNSLDIGVRTCKRTVELSSFVSDLHSVG